MIKFSAVGLTCVDQYNNLGYKYPAGNGIDLMFNLQNLYPELQCSVVTGVGDDENGKLVIEACRNRNVDVSHVMTVAGGKTATFQMLLNGKDRVHYGSDKGVMIDYQPTDEDMDFIREQDFIHTDFSWNVVDLLPDMRKKGTQIYFDFSKKYTHPDLERVLKNIDYGIFSFEEETQTVLDFLRYSCSLGPRVLIATFGERGSVCFDGSDYVHQRCYPAYYLENTVGAGDSFGAGFMSGILEGSDLRECMHRGALKSSKIVSIFEPYPMKPNESSYQKILKEGKPQ